MSSSDFSPSARRDGSSSSRPHSASGDETWLSTAELAARLKIPVKSLAAWTGSGRRPRYARMGRYRLGDVRAWEEQRFASYGKALREMFKVVDHCVNVSAHQGVYDNELAVTARDKFIAESAEFADTARLPSDPGRRRQRRSPRPGP